MFEKFLKNLVKNIQRIASLLDCIALKISELSLKEEYYVYVPSNNKPRVKHSSFLAAKWEAERLATFLSVVEDIEILQVVQRINGNEPPF